LCRTRNVAVLGSSRRITETDTKIVLAGTEHCERRRHLKFVGTRLPHGFENVGAIAGNKIKFRFH